MRSRRRESASGPTPYDSVTYDDTLRVVTPLPEPTPAPPRMTVLRNEPDVASVRFTSDDGAKTHTVTAVRGDVTHTAYVTTNGVMSSAFESLDRYRCTYSGEWCPGHDTDQPHDRVGRPLPRFTNG